MATQHTVEQSAAEVADVIGRAAYFKVYSLPNYAKPEVDDMLIPKVGLTTFKSYNNELGHRYHTHVTAGPSCGLRATREIGERVINNSFFTMTGVPNSYEPNFAPGSPTPPPTTFFPNAKVMLSAESYGFADGEGSEFHGIGVARFYTGAGGTLYIGGVGDMRDGSGQLRNVAATLTVNGYATHPPFFANEFIWRVASRSSEPFDAPKQLPPIETTRTDPEADSVLFHFLAEHDLDQPVQTKPMAGGPKQQVTLVEKLRLVNFGFDVGAGSLRTSIKPGDLVGERRTTLIFDPSDPLDVAPLYTINSVMNFHDSRGNALGSLNAELSEGRAFRTTSPDLANPYFRIAGHGWLGKGTGQFVKSPGVLSCNGALSLDPVASSSIYTLRIFDPFKRFQPVA